GNVGGTAARLFYEAGAKIIAVQDHTGTVHNASGLDVLRLLKHVEETGGVAGAPDSEPLNADEFWGLDTDILIPAALEGQIHEGNADRIRARIIVEGANGPTTPEADDILNDKGIFIVPDVLANAGGVTVSYFEWVQDFSSFFWTEDEINARLERMMHTAYSSVAGVAAQHKASLRTAACIAACSRLLEAREVRGLDPRTPHSTVSGTPGSTSATRGCAPRLSSRRPRSTSSQTAGSPGNDTTTSPQKSGDATGMPSRSACSAAARFTPAITTTSVPRLNATSCGTSGLGHSGRYAPEKASDRSWRRASSRAVSACFTRPSAHACAGHWPGARGGSCANVRARAT